MRNGFSLMEILVVLVVAGILLAGLSAATGGLASRLEIVRNRQASPPEPGHYLSLFAASLVPGRGDEVQCSKNAITSPSFVPVSLGGGLGRASLSVDKGNLPLMRLVGRDRQESGSFGIAAEGAAFGVLCGVSTLPGGAYRRLDYVGLRWRDAEGREHVVIRHPPPLVPPDCVEDPISGQCRS